MDHPQMSNGTKAKHQKIYIKKLLQLFHRSNINLLVFIADVVVIVAVIILVGLFSMQHYGTDKVGFIFAPIVLLWFILIGGIGMFNILKYDRNIVRAISPVYIFHYFRRGGKRSWTSLGGIMLSITGLFSCLLFIYIVLVLLLT